MRKNTKVFLSALLTVGLISTGSVQANQSLTLDLSGAAAFQESIKAMETSVPEGAIEQEAFRQALVFAIYDYKLAEAGKALENGGRLKAISRQAHGMGIKDLYANAIPYWKQELDVLQQAMMMGELKPGVTMAEAQAYIAKLQAMMSLGR